MINEAQVTRADARAELDNTPAPTTLDAAEIHAMIDALGDVGKALSNASTEHLASLYQAVNLQIRYEHNTHTADVTIQPTSRVNSERVRGPTLTEFLRDFAGRGLAVGSGWRMIYRECRFESCQML